MNNKAFLILAALIFLSGVAYAAFVPWDTKNTPPIDIAEGYSKAIATLGATNNYHCVGAEIYGDEWLYHFVSSTGEEKWVAVVFNGNTSIRTHRDVRH